jgi:hypothetical protein
VQLPEDELEHAALRAVRLEAGRIRAGVPSGARSRAVRKASGSSVSITETIPSP